MIFNILGIIIALFAIIITYFKWRYQYWKRKNIPYFEPNIPFGNLENSFTSTESQGKQIADLYHKFRKNGKKFGGVYIMSSALYLPVDLESIKNVMTKDFAYFSDRGGYYNEKDDPLSVHLITIGGNKWKNLRAKITPTFTSGKMKMMFNIFVECGEHLQKLMPSFQQEIDIKEVLGRFTTDIIGSCAFGLECNTLQEKDSPFRKYGKAIFNTSFVRLLKRNFAFHAPKIASALRMCLTPKDISDFFLKVVKDTVEYRQNNNITRNDFLQLLINIKDNGDGKGLTTEEIAAQCFVFFAAGFETSSTTMTFALYEMAINQDIQDKVRKEIFTVLEKHGGKITYDSVAEMKYLEQVIDESLRLHPPAPLVGRICVKDYKIPDTDIVLKKGTRSLISILGIHHDKEYYPEPLKFDPNRFTDENKKSRNQYTFIPFGEGPRVCIGARFGLLQTKIGLIFLLKNQRFTLNKKTKTPLKYAPRTIISTAVGEIWLDAHPIQSLN